MTETRNASPDTLGVEPVDMTEDERRRWLAGRDDWREDDWEDHCGKSWCTECSGEIPMTKPRAALTPPINDSGEGEPVGYFQHNAAWNAWEQVAEEFAGQDGVTALYAAPSPKGKTDGEALQKAIACIILDHVSGNDPEELIHHPAQKSWEAPTRPRWTQFIEAAEEILASLSNPSQALPDGEVGQ